ncbi:MAG: FtsK/SpoIIIE domain-containing protein [Sarcina sp.]
MASENNLLSPLVDAIWDTGVLVLNVAPKLYDLWGNFVYRLIEGKPYEDINKISTVDISVENVVKYRYMPLDELESSTIDNNLIKYKYIEGEKEGVRACIGYDIEGNPYWFNMLNSHCLVGGASRWGKSSFLNVFITSIMLTYTENEVGFMGCDFKRSDIYYYRKFKHFRNTVATNTSEFMQHMAKLEAEMLRRSEILEKSNCRNVNKYNDTHEDKLTTIIYVIDELPLLVSDTKCCDKLRLIMGKCASFSIYFLLATQDATKDSIGKCKMNCSQTVGFHTKDSTDSNTLIGSDILKDITVRGRCFIDSGAEITETQVFFLEEEEIEDLLKPYLKSKYKEGE